MPDNNLLSAAATLFTGASYTDIADWAEMMNLQLPHSETYYAMQRDYLSLQKLTKNRKKSSQPASYARQRTVKVCSSVETGGVIVPATPVNTQPIPSWMTLVVSLQHLISFR